MSWGDLQQVWAFLDEKGSTAVTAQAQIVLADGENMTIAAGGPLPRYSPHRSPYSSYEVLLDHFPSPVWARYQVFGTCGYSQVPRLLLYHHIATHGGMVDLLLETATRVRTGLMELKIAVDENREADVRAAITMMLGAGTGAKVLTSSYSLMD